MPRKKRTTSKPTICGICHRIIITNMEDYCHLEDYSKGRFLMEGWYHLKCYNDKIKGGEDVNLIKKKAMDLLNKAGALLGGEDKKEEVVYI